MSDLERIKPSIHSYLPTEGMNIFQKAGKKITLFFIGIIEHAKETRAMLGTKKPEAKVYEEGSSKTTEKAREVSSYIFKLVFSKKTFEEVTTEKHPPSYGSTGVTIRAPSGSDSTAAGISTPDGPSVRSPASSIGSDPGFVVPSPKAPSTSLERFDSSPLTKGESGSGAKPSEHSEELIEDPKVSRERTSSKESAIEAVAASSEMPYLSDADIKKEMKPVAKALETLPILNKKEITYNTPNVESKGFIFNKSSVSETIAEATKKCMASSKELYEQFQRMEDALEIPGKDPKQLDEEKKKLEVFVKDNPVFKELYALKEYLKAAEKDARFQELTFLNIDKAPVSETTKDYLEEYLTQKIWDQAIMDLGGRQNVTIVFGEEVLFSPEDLKGKELESYVVDQKKSQELLNTLVSKLLEKKKPMNIFLRLFFNTAYTPKEAKRKILNLFLIQSQGKEAIDLSKTHFEARTQFDAKKEELGLPDSLEYCPIGSDFEKMIPDAIKIDLKTDTVTKKGPRICKIMDLEYNYALNFPLNIKYETKIIGSIEQTRIKSDGISLETASIKRG
jgi:hypothetical protein